MLWVVNVQHFLQSAKRCERPRRQMHRRCARQRKKAERNLIPAPPCVFPGGL